jgi:hypothetical protein
MNSTALVAVPLVCLACVCAQQPVQGVLAGSPTGVQIDGGITATDAEMRVRTNGFTGPLLSFPVGQNLPNLREILQGSWPGAMGPFAVDLDDTSNGRDDVLIDENGVLAVPTSNWAVLSFSLRQGALGVPGSPIAVEAAAGSIGAALFSWLLPGTAVLPSQLVGGHAQLSHSRQVLGLAAGAEVDGVDIPVVLGRDQSALGTLETNFHLLIPSPQAIYFTVSSASAASTVTPDQWWSPGTPAANRSGATILRVIRSSPFGAWQGPMVWRRWADLGLNQSEDIDALAVDDTAQKVLYSVTGSARDQFLFADFSTDGGPPPPVPVTTAQGPISGQVGKAQNDDVDAVCTLDPTLGTTGMALLNGRDEFGSSCGAPTTPLLGVTPTIHASAFRRREAGATSFDTWMVGWPPLTGQGPGIAVPFLTLGGGSGPLLFLGPIRIRDVTDPMPGNPVETSVPVPPGLALQGARVVFRWAAIDANVTEIAEAWPVQVFL